MQRKVNFMGVLAMALFAFVKPSSAQSNLSEGYDQLFTLVTLISIGVFVLVVVLAVLFSYRYSENNEETERNPISHETARKLEFGWTAVAIVIVLLLMMVSYPVLFGEVDAASDSGDGIPIVVEGTQNWAWRFHLSNGTTINPVTQGVDQYTEITLQTGTKYTFTFYNSAPFIHSFFVYELNIKMDLVPGQNNTFTFQIEEPGSYGILCAEYCGPAHSNMKGAIIAEAA